MGLIHSIALIDSDDPSVALGRKIDTDTGYTMDIGFMGDSLGSLVAVLRGVDYDAHLEEMIDEVELNHEESPDADEFASVLTPVVVAEIAAIPSEKIDDVAAQWSEFEEELTWLEDRTPSQVLKILVDHCIQARLTGKHVLVHSYE